MTLYIICYLGYINKLFYKISIVNMKVQWERKCHDPRQDFKYIQIIYLFIHADTQVCVSSLIGFSHKSDLSESFTGMWDVKFDIQIGSDCPKMGQIWDFLRSVSVHFGSLSQNVLNLILKSPRFVPFWDNLIHFRTKSHNPGTWCCGWIVFTCCNELT